MITVALLAVGVPSLCGIVSLARRGRLKATSADGRGIALQTVIIMVVLLVIAGGVAAVLLNRGGEAVQDLQEQDVTRAEAGNIANSVLCTSLGYTWTNAACTG